MKEEFRIKSFDDYQCSMFKLVCSRHSGDKLELYNFYTGDVATIKQGELIPDEYIMKIPEQMKDMFMESFAKMLDEKNIKTENTHKLEGVLEATKYHLEDMRKIAKVN